MSSLIKIWGINCDVKKASNAQMNIDSNWINFATSETQVKCVTELKKN